MKKNYFGKKFGMLTVIDERELLLSEKALCRCDCGREKYVYVKYMVRGGSTSCGCKTNDFKTCPGMKFGRLTLVERIKIDGRYMWKCRCSCGNEKYICGSDLRSGKTKSCGCYQKERASISNKHDLLGEKFGRLTVVSEAGHVGKDTQWKCICDCGNISYVRTSCLSQGRTRSCGCLSREITSKTNTKDLSGRKFGKLTALSKEGLSKRGCVLWKCVCECGNECFVDSGDLMSGNNLSCGCLCSRAEAKFKIILNESSVTFIPQKTFEDCAHVRVLKFDFYIPSLSLCVELDGRQHFEPIEFFGGITAFLETQLRDQIKNTYCPEHNINLLRIPYTDFNRLEEICKENKII